MASIDRYRPARESYQPPSLPPKPPPPVDRLSRSPTRRHVPPPVPSPPAISSRTSPPRPASRRVPPSPAQGIPQPPASVAPPRPSQWFFTPEEILSSPSIVDGLRPSEERFRRAKGVNFIFQVGIMLELPQLTLWAASVFFHRFYMRVSLMEEKNGIHHYNIAATSLFLANKTQEDCRKTKDFIISVARVAQKNTNLVIDEQSKEYWRWRDSILTHEEIMLELLTFDLMVDNPHNHMFEYLKRLSLLHKRSLRDSAWAYCNDACFTTLPLLMSATDIAASSIFFAAVSTRSTIEDVAGDPWWCHLSADEDRIIKAIDVMSAFYNENPLQKKDDRYQGSPVFTLESTRRRGDIDAATLLSQTQSQGQNQSQTQAEAGGVASLASQTGSPLAASTEQDDNGPVIHGSSTSQINTSSRSDDSKKASKSALLSPDLQPFAQQENGNSDAALKAEANDLDRHVGHPVDGGLVSPGTKRGTGSDAESDREPKRPRIAAYEDEGEILES